MARLSERREVVVTQRQEVYDESLREIREERLAARRREETRSAARADQAEELERTEAEAEVRRIAEEARREEIMSEMRARGEASRLALKTRLEQYRQVREAAVTRNWMEWLGEAGYDACEVYVKMVDHGAGGSHGGDPKRTLLEGVTLGSTPREIREAGIPPVPFPFPFPFPFPRPRGPPHTTSSVHRFLKRCVVRLGP